LSPTIFISIEIKIKDQIWKSYSSNNFRRRATANHYGEFCWGWLWWRRWPPLSLLVVVKRGR